MILKRHNLLGKLLRQAGLISNSQIRTVLADRQYSRHLRIGEIMTLRGWIDRQTADFFADEWSELLMKTDKKPLGYYLEKAGLLTEQQTESVLKEQKQIWVKFGSVAVLQGLIEQKTVDFFLTNLFPLEAIDSPLIGKKEKIIIDNIAAEKTNLVKLIKTESQSEEIDYDDIPWIN